MRTLTNWIPVKHDLTCHIQGNVTNHPKFPDGSYVTTSRIIRVEARQNMHIAITDKGQEYRLAFPANSFKQRAAHFFALMNVVKPVLLRPRKARAIVIDHVL